MGQPLVCALSRLFFPHSQGRRSSVSPVSTPRALNCRPGQDDRRPKISWLDASIYRPPRFANRSCYPLILCTAVHMYVCMCPFAGGVVDLSMSPSRTTPDRRSRPGTTRSSRGANGNGAPSLTSTSTTALAVGAYVQFTQPPRLPVCLSFIQANCALRLLAFLGIFQQQTTVFTAYLTVLLLVK